MSTTERPLSPHLQVYRWRISMFTSIMHRATGVFLSLGTPLLAAWLIAASSPSPKFEGWQFFGTAFGKTLLFLWTLAFFYHMANGVRHLFWDIGKGFEKKTYKTSGWLTLVFAVVATAVVWYPLLTGGAA